MQPEQRPRAVMFADISGSTSLYQSLGDNEAHRVIELCLQTMRSTVAQHGGRVVKAIGDALLCVFDDACAATSTASEVQSRLDTQRGMDRLVPAMRIGVSYGAVLEDAGDVFGDTVNIAARVAALATSGQVFITLQTREALPPLLRACCRPLYAIEVKGVHTKVSIYDVVWKLDAELTLVAGSQPMGKAEPAGVLCLTYRGKNVCLGDEQRAVRLGRDPDNDLVITAKTASRRHARVHLYEGNFVLVDESANGTFVQFEAQAELHLRREETVLIGRGVIGLGMSTSADSADTVAFRVE